jgi:hypothetical protein
MPAQVGVRAADLHGMAAMLCPIAYTAGYARIFVSFSIQYIRVAFRPSDSKILDGIGAASSTPY